MNDDHQWLSWVPRLRRYSRPLVNNRDGADGLVQDRLKRAWAKSGLWGGSTQIRDMRAWPVSIMHKPHVDGVRRPGALPGLAKAQAICAACHSAECMQYRLPTAPCAYWDAIAKRMKIVFNAPIADEDIPLIADYLVKASGDEQAR